MVLPDQANASESFSKHRLWNVKDMWPNEVEFPALHMQSIASPGHTEIWHLTDTLL